MSRQRQWPGRVCHFFLSAGAMLGINRGVENLDNWFIRLVIYLASIAGLFVVSVMWEFEWQNRVRAWFPSLGWKDSDEMAVVASVVGIIVGGTLFLIGRIL
jgi:hypothetical protein